MFVGINTAFFEPPSPHILCHFISLLKSMEGKQYNQEARPKHGSYWTRVWTLIVTGHWGRNSKSLMVIPMVNGKPLFQWKCLANEHEEFLLINDFHLALLSCQQCYDSVIRLNGLFLETHRLASWLCRAASCLRGADFQRPFLNHFLHKSKLWQFASACEIRYTHCDGQKYISLSTDEL